MDKLIIEQAFIDSIKSEHHAHAFLISCIDSHRSEALAIRAASYLCKGVEGANLDNCPYFICLEPTALTKRDDRLNFRRDIAFAQGDNKNRVILFKNAHLMPESVQNAILKTLEDPPDNTVIILTGMETGLLPTVRSRCTKLRLPPIDDCTMKETLRRLDISDRANTALRICGGAENRAIALSQDKLGFEVYNRAIELIILPVTKNYDWSIPDKWLKDREITLSLIEYMLSFTNEMLLWHDCKQSDCSDAAKEYAERFSIMQLQSIADAAMSTLKLLKSLNVRTEESMDGLMAKIINITSK